MTGTERPTVIIPYRGVSENLDCRDIFVYLRPETNGVLVESSLMRVIDQTALYREKIELIYLANIPGVFIVKNKIVEDHYRYKLPFARRGGSLFTVSMQERFELHFLESFDARRVIGAFEALSALQLTEEELFATRVGEDLVLNLNCQIIKKIEDVYVVNYDIPALLHKNNYETDIAVMLFRSTLANSDFHRMIEEMNDSLEKNGVLKAGLSYSRAFHYSRGPFEQILDARGHLYAQDGTHVPLSDMQFCSFLRTKGAECREIEMTLDNPIMTFRTDSGEVVEDCIYTRTQDVSYQEAHRILERSESQYLAGLAELATAGH